VSDVLDQLQSLKLEAEEVQRKRMKREADRDAADHRLKENLAKLAAEFGTQSVEEARDLLEEMESRIAVGMRDLRQKLAEVQA
jgi:hypothetical protein